MGFHAAWKYDYTSDILSYNTVLKPSYIKKKKKKKINNIKEGYRLNKLTPTMVLSPCCTGNV